MNNRTREFSDDVLDLSDQQVFEDTGLLSVNKNIDRPKPEKISFEAEGISNFSLSNEINKSLKFSN